MNAPSKLTRGSERFLAHTIEHAIEVGRRTSDDFIRHFPPRLIMEGLKDHPELRAGILVPTTGVKERVALKKGWESSSEDLQIALDEGETDAESIVGLFELEDRVRFLDHEALWRFVTEGEFWKSTVADKDEFEAAKAQIAFMLERALEDTLVTHDDIVAGITVKELSIRLPKEELGKIIQGALDRGSSGGSFTQQDLLAAMPPSVIVDHVPLDHIWMKVIEPHIARRHEYLPAQSGDTAETPTTKQLGDAINRVKPANDAPDKPKAAPDTPPSKMSAGGASPPRKRPAKPAVSSAGDFEDPGSWVEQLSDVALEDADLLEDSSAVGS